VIPADALSSVVGGGNKPSSSVGCPVSVAFSVSGIPVAFSRVTSVSVVL